MPLKIMLNTKMDARRGSRGSGLARRWATLLLLWTVALGLTTRVAAQTPPAPTNLAATIGDGTATLTWSPVSSASGYELCRSTTSGGPYSHLAYINSGTTSFTDTGLQNGTAYYYVLNSYNNDGFSAFSSEINVSPTINAPVLSLGSTGDGTATLSWSSVGNADGYELFRSTTSGGPYNHLGYINSGTTSFTDTGLQNGTAYFYVVKSYNNGGFSTNSNQITVNLSLVPPTLSISAMNAATASLSWSSVSNADGYELFRSTTSGGPYNHLAYINSGTTSFTDTGLQNGTSYYYVVKCYNNGGFSTNSNEVSVSPTINAPVLSLSSTGAAAATLSWSSVGNADGYELFRSTTSGGPYNHLAYTSSGTTSFTDTGLQDGTSYYYVVKSYNAAGFSAYSNEISNSSTLSTPSGPPPAPTNLATQPGNQQVALSWTAVSGATGYTVKVSPTSGGPYTNVTIPGALTGTSYTDHYLTNETTYYFVVTAVNNSGESANSNEVSAIPFGLPPNGPASLTAVPGAGQVSLSWAAASGLVRGYIVQRAMTTGGPYTTLATGPGTTYTDTAVTNGVPYFYVVTAFNTGGDSPMSDEAMAEPFVSPAAPSVTPSYGYSSDGLRAWKSVGGSTTYFLYDGSQPVCELDGSGAVTATNTWGGQLLSRRTGTGLATASTFYTFDPSGNIAQRLDGAGNVLGAYAFDAFGLRTGTDSTTDPYAGFGGAYGYYADAETGLSLLGHRYYDTGMGRFINRDPMGYAGGADLYSFTQNNPINFSDPTGYWGIDDAEQAAQNLPPGARNVAEAGLLAIGLGVIAYNALHNIHWPSWHWQPLPPVVAVPPGPPIMAVPIPGVTKPPIPVPGDPANGWKWNPNPNYPGKGRPGKWGPAKPIPGRGGGQPGASWDPQASGKGIPHWDVDDGLGNRERCDENGNPLTDKEAHGQ